MVRRGTMRENRGAMLSRAVAFVFAKPKLGKGGVQGAHASVSGHFRHHRRRGDGGAYGVAFGDRRLIGPERWNRQSIDQMMRVARFQSLDRSNHREMRRIENVEFVNFLSRGVADSERDLVRGACDFIKGEPSGFG